MALLTIPSTPQRGAFQSYSLNQSDLIALVTQSYFQEITNWRKVIVTYVSSVSNQLSIISFTPDELNNVISAPGFFSDEARTTFRIANISIYDKQNGRFRLERTQIPNVDDYNLIFASSTGQLSFYGVAFTGGDASTSLSFNANNSNELIIGTQNAFSLGASASWETVLNLPDGSFDSATTSKIMDSKIVNAFYNDDLTKAWVIGQFGLTCCGQALPALPTDTASFGSDPFRLVEIDLVANTVTLKADIRQYSGPSGSGTYLGGAYFTVIIDETVSTALVTSVSYISSYSMSTGNLGWFNTFIPISDPYIGGVTPRIMRRSADGAYIGVSQYAGVNETNNGGIIKISFATGAKVPGYDATPAMSNGKYSFWSSSPDTLKQVIPGQQVGTEMPVVVFNNGVASVFNLTNPDSNYAAYAVTCANDNFYIVGNGGNIFKYDYLGNFVAKVVSSGAWPVSLTPPQFSSTAFGVYDGFLYCADRNGVAISKFNESTGARVSSFLGIKSSPSSGTFGQFFFFSSGKMVVNKSAEYSGYAYTTYTEDPINTVNSIAIIDYTTKDLVSYLQTSNYFTYMNGLKPLTSTLLPNKIIGVDLSYGPRVYDTTTAPWTLESGWPERPGAGGAIYGGAVIGEYIYFGTGGSTGIQMTDSGGIFYGTQMVRVNINTKLIDRTFSPVFPNIGSFSYGGTQAVITNTDNYIYMCICDTFSGYAGLWRIKKSDLSVQQIQASDFGFAAPFGNYKVNVTQIATNTVVMYPDKSSYNYDPSINDYTTLGGKPYLVLNEETLALTGTQSTTTTDAPIRLVYNPSNGILGGVSNVSGAGKRFVTYDIATGSRSLASQDLSSPSGNNYLQPNTVFPMICEGENFLFLCATPLIYGRKIYTGVVRMNPLGVLNN